MGSAGRTSSGPWLATGLPVQTTATLAPHWVSGRCCVHSLGENPDLSIIFIFSICTVPVCWEHLFFDGNCDTKRQARSLDNRSISYSVPIWGIGQHKEADRGQQQYRGKCCSSEGTWWMLPRILRYLMCKLRLLAFVSGLYTWQQQ